MYQNIPFGNTVISITSNKSLINPSLPGREICFYLCAAPAAYDTISAFFKDTSSCPADYDMILTGDLGLVGKSILIDAFSGDGIDISGNYDDCGCIIYSPGDQDTHAGGSGCGCGASVLCGHILNSMLSGACRKILFCATGALMSPLSAQQGESIPSICHLIEINTVRE